MAGLRLDAPWSLRTPRRRLAGAESGSGAQEEGSGKEQLWRPARKAAVEASGEGRGPARSRGGAAAGVRMACPEEVGSGHWRATARRADNQAASYGHSRQEVRGERAPAPAEPAPGKLEAEAGTARAPPRAPGGAGRSARPTDPPREPAARTAAAQALTCGTL